MFFSDNAKWKQEENGSSPHTHCICSSCTDRTNRAVCKIHYYAQDIATVRFSEYIIYWTKSLPLPISEALPGGSHITRLNFKTSRVGVYKCLSLIVGFAVTVAIWPREVVSCHYFILRAVAPFWAMSLVRIYPGRTSLVWLGSDWRMVYRHF